MKQEPHLPNDALSFRDALAFFWGARKHMFAGFAAGLIAATLLLLTTRPAYEASVSLAPPNISLPGTDFRGGAGAEGSGLTSILGLKAANEGPSPYDRVMLMFQGREIAEKLARDPVIMRTIFASDWDGDKKTWSHRWSASNAMRGLVYWMFGRGDWTPPGPDELSAYIQSTVLIKPADQHGVTLITYRNFDARFARYFLEKLILTADDSIRESDRRRYQQYQSFLSEQIGKASAVDIRQSLIALFTSVTQHTMLVASDTTYAMDVLDGPNVSKRPVSPSIIKAYLMLAMIGVAGGLLLAMAHASGLVPERTLSWRPWRPRLSGL